MALALHRAGVRLYWNFEQCAFVVESKYISRFVAPGKTENEALAAFGKVIQEPNSWRSVVEELMGRNPRFVEILIKEVEYMSFESNDSEEQDQPSEEWNDLNHPMTFWNEVLFPVFRKAYDDPKDDGLINRIYAFADWSFWQDQEGETNPGKHLCTCCIICFFENLMGFAKGLADMPNWFNSHEIDWVFEGGFCASSRQSFDETWLP
jgi:hypothetical protein